MVTLSTYLQKNSWFGDSGASCLITTDDIGMYEITKIDGSMQVNSDSMKTTNKGELCIISRQVNGSEILHTLWPVKYCKKAGANPFNQPVSSCKELS